MWTESGGRDSSNYKNYYEIVILNIIYIVQNIKVI